MADVPAFILTSTSFSQTLTTALNEFHQALTKRWIEEAWAGIRQSVAERSSELGFPTSMYAPVNAHLMDLQISGLNHRSLPTWFHINGGHCGYAAWVEGGQEGPLGGVTCDGRTGADAGGEVMHDYIHGEDVLIPPYIACGVGGVFRLIESSAWAERVHVFSKLPLFDHHNLAVLEAAHDEFISVGKRLGLQPHGEAPTELGNFAPVTERDLEGIVEALAGRSGVGADWWAGWTGLVAARARSGFFDSCAPTARNQSGILGSLANLYSDRAVIIAKGRNDALEWIQWATASLDETELVMVDRTAGWKAVEGLGMTASVYGSAGSVFALPIAAPIGATGAALKLFGFLGSNFLGETTREQYVYEIREVVQRLNDEVDKLVDKINSLEQEYAAAVSALSSTIYGIHSYNLELYDFTANGPAGDRTENDSGFHADIDSVLKIAEECYDAGMHYHGLLAPIARTSDADSHLADQDGTPTPADTELLTIRERLYGFLRTTCGRYLLAGDQVVASAEAYVAVDTDQRDVFNRTIEDWADNGVGYDVDFSPSDDADATDRPDGAGAEDDGGYVTDGEELVPAR